MLGALLPWLEAQGLEAPRAAQVVLTAEVLTVGALAVLANLVVKGVVVCQLQRWMARSPTTWDDPLIPRKVFHRLSHLAPAMVIFHFAPLVLDHAPAWLASVQ